MSDKFRGVLKEHEPLARYTSWRVGGKARRFYKPFDLQDLGVFLKSIPENEELLWMGLGSNLLIRDGGVPGTVIFTLGCLNKIEQADDTVIRAEAGVTCAKLAKWCAKLGFESGAFFAGIPGTVGGALAMNASAFGGITWEKVILVETIDRHGKVRTRHPKDFQVNYREVLGPSGEWFVAGHFCFEKGNVIQAEKAIHDLLKKRSETQPIGKYSCGSVFRNPSGDYAARLIESSGLKGKRIGDAWVSDKHANFILNGGNATASQIETLINFVADVVEEKQKVRLIPEVHIVGETQCYDD